MHLKVSHESMVSSSSADTCDSIHVVLHMTRATRALLGYTVYSPKHAMCVFMTIVKHRELSGQKVASREYIAMERYVNRKDVENNGKRRMVLSH